MTLHLSIWFLNRSHIKARPCRIGAGISLYAKRETGAYGYCLGKCEEIKSVGIALARLGENYDHALSLLEQSFTELESLHEEFCMAYFGPYYSELFAAQAKRKLSDRFARSLDLARKVDERGLLADVLSHYATWLFTTNRLEEAVQRAEEADRLFIQLGDVAFEYEFVEGQKLSLDEVLDLALKTVEEM